MLAISLIWEYVGGNFNKIYFVIGKPSEIIIELFYLITEERLFHHIYITGSEAILGLIIGTFLGSLAGLALWFSKTVSDIVRPFVIALGTFPVFAFAPLMIIWFGIGFQMKVAMATFSTVFVAFNQANKGANLVSEKLIETLKGMDASRIQIFFKIIVPGTFDWVLSSMRINIGFGLLGAFIGEFIASNEGLGYLILRAGGLYNVPKAFAASFGIILLALTLDRFGNIVESKRYFILQVFSTNSVLKKYEKKILSAKLKFLNIKKNVPEK